ncbi:MAG: hypothetical protein COA78_17855 [Blastopirellula sp.]|nr:MAG: hypothetical protein COA78_17855 [Blastopirellula sp.]
MSEINFVELQQQIIEATRTAFTELKAARNEDFYSFVLYTRYSPTVIIPTANSEQAYAQFCKINSSKYSRSQLDFDFRWSPFDWEYQCHGVEHFFPLNDMLEENFDLDDPNCESLQAELYATMISALSVLNSERLFGEGTDREEITVFCSVLDSMDADWLEMKSSEILNPSSTHTKFSDILLKLKGPGPSFSLEEYDKVYSAFLKHFPSTK